MTLGLEEPGEGCGWGCGLFKEPVLGALYTLPLRKRPPSSACARSRLVCEWQ